MIKHLKYVTCIQFFYLIGQLYLIFLKLYTIYHVLMLALRSKAVKYLALNIILI